MDQPAVSAAIGAPLAAAASAADAGSADLRIAHLMLRCGNALPARVQLETLAGRQALDARGLLDLAESRWRTGDLAGAGDAVVAYLEAGGSDAVGYLIAAEATAALGRPGEARKLARRALEDLALPLDVVFAGQARSSIWPRDPTAPAQAAATLFAPPATEAARGGRIGLTSDSQGARDARPTVAAGPGAPSGHGPNPAAHLDDPGFNRAADPQATGSDAVSAELKPDRSLWDSGRDAQLSHAAAELDAAREALEANDPRAVAVRLGIVLRISPALAPAVLELAGELPGPDFDLLRGDALRLVGREAAAERSFAAAADALRQPPPPGSTE